MKNRRYRVTLCAHAVEKPPPGVLVDKLDEANGPLAIEVEAPDAAAAIEAASIALNATIHGHAKALRLLGRLADKDRTQ